MQSTEEVSKTALHNVMKKNLLKVTFSTILRKTVNLHIIFYNFLCEFPYSFTIYLRTGFF